MENDQHLDRKENGDPPERGGHDRDSPAAQPLGQAAGGDVAGHHRRGDPEKDLRGGHPVEAGDIPQPWPGPQALDRQEGCLGGSGERGDAPEAGAGGQHPRLFAGPAS